jgi:hypothetical protein
MHHHPAESLLPRAASNMSQQSSAAPSSVGLEENKIKLRLCYGGGFKQVGVAAGGASWGLMGKCSWITNPRQL